MLDKISLQSYSSVIMTKCLHNGGPMATSKKAASKHSKEHPASSMMPPAKMKPAPVVEPLKHKPSKPKTKIIVHMDCGFANNLFIRGEGVATLSWEKGLPLKNIKADEWVWESDRPFSTMQYKILLNDSQFESGENHTLGYGQEADFTPTF